MIVLPDRFRRAPRQRLLPEEQWKNCRAVCHLAAAEGGKRGNVDVGGGRRQSVDVYCWPAVAGPAARPDGARSTRTLVWKPCMVALRLIAVQVGAAGWRKNRPRTHLAGGSPSTREPIPRVLFPIFVSLRDQVFLLGVVHECPTLQSPDETLQILGKA